MIGLEKGELSEEDICVKVVREFFLALKTKNYAKAGQVFSGMPASKIEEYFGKLNVVQIISIGKPYPHPTPGVGGYRVPCEIEIEHNGEKHIMKKSGVCVREVHGQPERWNIHGGI